MGARVAREQARVNICLLARQEIVFYSTFGEELNLQDSRIFGSIVKDEIAEIVDNRLPAVVIDALQRMRVAANNNVGTGIEVIFSGGLLNLLQLVRPLGAPMDNSYNIIAIYLCLFDSIYKFGSVVTE